MTYKCTICDYSTEDSRNYTRHTKSAKHVNNCEEAKKHEKFICQNCGQKYNYSQGLSRHKKNCAGPTTNEDKKINVEYLMSELMKANEHVKELLEKTQKIEIEMLEKTRKIEQEKNEVKIEMLEKNEKYLKTLVNEAGTMVKTSVTALSYATKYYTETPILQQLPNYEKLGTIEDDNQLVDVFDILPETNYDCKISRRFSC